MRRPNGYWTFERCLEAASLYSSRTAFAHGHGAAYVAAKKNGWLAEIYAVTKPNGVGHGYWTESRLLVEGRKHGTIKGFRTRSPSAYATACRLGLLPMVTAHMSRSGGLAERVVYLILSRVSRQVYVGLSCNLRRRVADHRRAGQASVRAILAGPHKITCSARLPKDEAARLEASLIRRLRERGYEVVNGTGGGSLGAQRQYWTEERVRAAALGYTSRMQFKLGNKSAYLAAMRLAILDEVCAHMRRPPSEKLKWTPEAIAIEAQPYRSRTEFFNGSKGAYCAAHERGLLDDVCAHMVDARDGNPGQRKWPRDRIATEAKRYTSKSQFKRGSPGAFEAARRLGILPEVCAHMPLSKETAPPKDLGISSRPSP